MYHFPTVRFHRKKGNTTVHIEKRLQLHVPARIISYYPFLRRKDQQFAQEMADEAAAIRKTQESREWKQANYDRVRAQILRKTDTPTKQKRQSPSPTKTQ